jgi:protein-tyrosine-phosphatase
VPNAPLNVLFLCTGNAARSIIGEAILNREGLGRFRGYSAGSHPKGAPHPYAIDLLRRLGHDTAFARSKRWEEFAAAGAPKMDFVITLCDDAAAEACPVWPGQPMTAHWGLPDPSAADGNEAERRLAFAETYRMLRNRITILASLPIGALERLSLQRRLDDIGRTDGPAAISSALWTPGTDPARVRAESDHSRPSRSSSRAKKASWSISRTKCTFFGRRVTPHQSTTVWPMVSSEPVSTSTFTSRPS